MEPRTKTFEGMWYSDDDRDFYVFDRFAYMRYENGFHVSIPPHRVEKIVSENGDGETIRMDFLWSGSTLYVPDEVGCKFVGNTDFSIDGAVYAYDGKASRRGGETVVVLEPKDSSDDTIVRSEDYLKSAIADGEIDPLWPVWKTATVRS